MNAAFPRYTIIDLAMGGVRYSEKIFNDLQSCTEEFRRLQTQYGRKTDIGIAGIDESGKFHFLVEDNLPEQK